MTYGKNVMSSQPVRFFHHDAGAHLRLMLAAHLQRPQNQRCDEPGPTAAAVKCSRLLDGAAPLYSEVMKVAFDLPPAQAEKLKQEAARLGLSPDDLARAALADLLAMRDDDFRAAADRVLEKNRELYRRLA